jgi:autoinducer 2 (AI-2) kinase
MMAALEGAVRAVVAGTGSEVVRAVTTTSVRGAFVLTGANDEVLFACGSSDARAAAEVATMLPSEPTFHRATGQKLALAAVPRLRWLARERPGLVQRATRLLTLDAWVAQQLAGTDVAASASAASTTGLLDLAARGWLADDDPWRQGVPRSWLPPVAEAASVAGTIGAAASGRTGLSAGTPIIVGGGDAQMAGLGLGRVEEGDAAIILGSHWQQTLTLARPTVDAQGRFRTICHALPGTWQADAIVWGAGLFLEWARRAFRGSSGEGEKVPTEAFADLEAAAAALPPGAGGVTAVAGLPMTEARWQNASPSLIGFSLEDPTGSRAATVRAVIEAGAFAAAVNLATLVEGSGLPPSPSLRVGGGASRSDLVCRILADVTGRAVERTATSESTVVGGAVVAGTAIGWFADVATGSRELARVTTRFEPDPSIHHEYRALLPRWQAVAAAQRALAAGGVTRPVWRPAR